MPDARHLLELGKVATERRLPIHWKYYRNSRCKFSRKNNIHPSGVIGVFYTNQDCQSVAL
jgi:hypothetical protein